MRIQLQVIPLFIVVTLSSQKLYSQTAAFTFSPQHVCTHDAVQFTDQSTGATTFLWDFGNGLTSVLQNPSLTYFTQGTYIVTLSINGGASIASDTIVVGSLPIGPDIIFGTPASCIGTGGIGMYYGYPVPDSATYVWSVPPGAIIIDSIAGPSVRVLWTGFVVGIIALAATNDCGTSSTPFILSELVGLDTSITLNASTLVSNALFCSYQWIECPAMTVLAGDTNKTFTPLVNGSYAVIVNMEGCVDTSNCWNVITTGVFSPEMNESDVTIFPNPTANSFTIKNISLGETLSIQIINSTGEVVYVEKLFGKEEYLIEKDFAKGIYCVRVNNIVRKLVVE